MPTLTSETNSANTYLIWEEENTCRKFHYKCLLKFKVFFFSY